MYIRIISFFILFSFVSNIKCSSPQGREVSEWARAIGHELRSLGQEVTLYDEIKQRYTYLKAKVGKNDPRALLAEVKENISRMIDRKTDAIKYIQEKAEEVAELFEYNRSAPFQYYSSKWSSITGAESIMKVPKSLSKNRHMYINLTLNNDTHFYNLPVNTSHSSVHVPTNVFDMEDAAAFAIQWSKELDEVFIGNYNSDPALSWQYFGSSSGIMRHYPAKRWEDYKKDLFDCRIRTWFIEAATCTKDVVILMDNSGSMKGMGHHIGSLTASSILDTFSNNDFINVLNYSSTTSHTIPCFERKLVQATRENIEIFRKAIELMEPEGKTDIALALETAFDLLDDYRMIRGCSENSTHCNQAIMIITDGVNSNLSDIVLRRNHYNNGLHIPVRIFTYLVGKEVTNVEEIKWLSCANRGYYTPVPTLEQVTSSVLQYIGVVARPLVLQAEKEGEHPVSWTHAYVDRTYDDKNDNQINEPYRLLTSAAIPCYDTKINRKNDTRTAYLLGVAGTDVPLDEFNKMTLPYKIGVNGYSFIVSNNGYVLMHPDLRPVFEGILKDNYNSIDLTQVEQHNDQLPARAIGETLKNLRQALVDGKEGSLHNISLSYHYDDMKRISEQYYDYYYTPIQKTPFTIGIAIPTKYGSYSLEVDDEIQRNKNTGEDLLSFFSGKWKVHPKWVYCKYHYLEGHEFDTPEQELIHFLGKMRDRNFHFQWKSQYEGKKDNRNEVTDGRKEDDYYCDKQLVQRLIFDARNTHTSYRKKFQFKINNSSFLFYKPSLRFVATMSGLTRWEYIFDQTNSADPKSKKKEFGDLHPRAINEKWYKNAVLQHHYDNESFVYSVPFDCGFTDIDPVVTGSYAIFPSDGGLEAPGSVVGFQFNQIQFKTMVKAKSTILTPLAYTGVFIRWIFAQIIYFLMELNLYSLLEQIAVYAQEDSTNGNIYAEDNEEFLPSNKNEYYACEKEIILYVLQQEIFNKENFTGEIYTPNIRNYYVKKIPYSNLIFVAINNTMKDTKFSFSTAPRQITKEPIFTQQQMNSTLLPCQKLELNNLSRRHLTGCYNEHPLEHEIIDCGRASYIKINLFLYTFLLSIKLYI
ncbi:voltage-dependent calcium channel subunit alpha-2/delta-3 isoform X2 [Anoplophora glabripennis]|uniref:voltage-dependent calcium channel subunit alpha-2/delta-3 isoform X2 n=1 Tax=Anoplophora glabripennis TaxID=217634 RepID=UPI0008736484|nr:voltage-dependent calcium channel subunit alpha-2/delta-3 isoform X2 [Anoplophora glabripennis]